MATSLDKLEKKATGPSSARNALSYGVKIAKIGPVDPEILHQIGPFLAVSYQTFSNEPCQLWSYWTEFHKIFIQYTGINSAVNVPIDVAISHTVSERQSDENAEFAIFCIKSVAMATSLQISKKEVQIDHLWPKSFHLECDRQTHRHTDTRRWHIPLLA